MPFFRALLVILVLWNEYTSESSPEECFRFSRISRPLNIFWMVYGLRRL